MSDFHSNLKVLAVAHNPFSTYQNMGKTLVSMFSDFDRTELCQLYIYPTVPDSDKATSYYRITDKDVLRSYYKFRVDGKVITPTPDMHAMFENADDEALYRNRKNKKPLRMLLRDLMWKLAPWYNKGLRTWIEEQAPSCIFVAPGTAKFIYDIAFKISKAYKLPIVSYICDDYYFVKSRKGILARLEQSTLKKKIKALIKKSAHVITICDELKEAYSAEFNVPVTTVMTGSSYSLAEQPKKVDEPKAITYMGNIRCNRYHSLAEIGRTLDEINLEKGTSYELRIYTAEKDAEILSSFAGIKSVKLCGFVSGEEFKEVFYSSDILLHTEGHDEASVDLVKHSVSTKIADSLASGIPFFAYGPDCVASVKHLLKNDCAIVATSGEELREKLLEAFENAELREAKCKNALECAKAYHDGEAVAKKIRGIFEEI